MFKSLRHDCGGALISGGCFFGSHFGHKSILRNGTPDAVVLTGREEFSEGQARGIPRIVGQSGDSESALHWSEIFMLEWQST